MFISAQCLSSIPNLVLCALHWSLALADPTAVAAQGPIAAWDTREETNLSAIFVDAAEFNEGLNTCVLTFAVWRARLLSLGVGSI